MKKNYQRWRQIFLFASGLALGAAFCMKWMEDDLLLHGEKFTILGLELFYPQAKVDTIVKGIDDYVRTVLMYHLSFDFAFMAAVYPGIAALCMMAREKTTGQIMKKVLLILAMLQALVWGCDIFENIELEKWIRDFQTDNSFKVYHLVVASKWILVFSGLVIAIPLAIRRRRFI